MKHKAKVIVETEKKGLFGTKKFREERVIEVDEKEIFQKNTIFSKIWNSDTI